jgi:hypothetical protein
MIDQLVNTSVKSLRIFLAVISGLNLWSIVILTFFHWMTGKWGYLIVSFYFLFGLIISFTLILLNRQMQFNGRTLVNLLLTIVFGSLAYVDIDIFIDALNNAGYIPCDLGLSCP